MTKIGDRKKVGKINKMTSITFFGYSLLCDVANGAAAAAASLLPRRCFREAVVVVVVFF